MEDRLTVRIRKEQTSRAFDVMRTLLFISVMRALVSMSGIPGLDTASCGALCDSGG